MRVFYLKMRLLTSDFSDTMITIICHIYIPATIYCYSRWTRKLGGRPWTICKTTSTSCESGDYTCRSDFSDTMITHICHIYISTAIYCYSKWVTKLSNRP